MENEWSSRVTDRRHTIPGGTDRAAMPAAPPSLP
jgi:hypothetical protein